MILLLVIFSNKLALLSTVIPQRSENENSDSRNATVAQSHELTLLLVLCWLMILSGMIAENRNVFGLFK